MKDMAKARALIAPEKSADRAGIDQESLVDRSSDELMLLAQRGDRGAQEALFARHRLELVRFARRRLKTDAAEEVVDGVLQGLLVTAPQRFRPEGTFTTYARAVVRSRCLDANRRAARGETRTSRVGCASSQTLGLDERLSVRRVLARLSEKLSAVVVLRYFGGHDFEEIGEMLGIRAEAARRRHSDALSQLRRLCAEEPSTIRDASSRITLAERK